MTLTFKLHELHSGRSIRDPYIRDKKYPVLNIFRKLRDFGTENFCSKGFFAYLCRKFSNGTNTKLVNLLDFKWNHSMLFTQKVKMFRSISDVLNKYIY